MQAKLSSSQFDEIVKLSYPSYMIKASQICIGKCNIDLTTEVHERKRSLKEGEDDKQVKAVTPQVRKSDELLYLSDREALCIESCARMHIRQTNKMVDVFKKELAF